MKKHQVTRRGFIISAASVSAAALAGCKPARPADSVTVYRRSARGRRVSNAAKKHAANHLYTDALAAALDKAHPGDTCKVVPLTISRARFNEIFPNGQTVADLRGI